METGKSIGSSLIEFQRGLSLDQAKLVSLEREQGQIKGQLVQVVQTLQQLVIAQNQNQNQNQPRPQSRVRAARRREVVESKTEPSSQDEESDDQSEEEEQTQRRNLVKCWNQEPRDDSKAKILNLMGRLREMNSWSDF